ncbi:MAG: hypothetical protein DMG06_30650 [Acidobacteria bacterium]|nr:MAG: hypothetical protein DMG06_30650 [Acidobacteriota bacterium]
MPGKRRLDQRQERRYPFSGLVRAHDLPLYGLSKALRRPIPGIVKDISSGGLSILSLSILSDRALKPSSLLRCAIRFSDLPVSLPVLSQVRWIQRDDGERKYKIGLQFLL